MFMSGADTVYGSAFADSLYGFDANDVIDGRGGADALFGDDEQVNMVLQVRPHVGLVEHHRNAKVAHKHDPITLAVQLQEAGAGEIVVNSVDRDGLMQGYDLDLAAQFRQALRVPVTFLGGAGSLDDIGQLVSRVGVVGAAAGSLFVFKGKYRAVLINYPTPVQKTQLCRDALKI
mgnify:CR=1 FL=1